MKEKPWVTLLFLLPACSLLGGLVLYPGLQALFLSFTDYNMIQETRFVGLANYQRLAADPVFWAALRNKDRFSQLLIIGVAVNFFLYIAINLSMVMGMAPVVGVPLPLLSYGGSATLVVMIAFGLVQSAIVHRPR